MTLGNTQLQSKGSGNRDLQKFGERRGFNEYLHTVLQLTIGL